MSEPPPAKVDIVSTISPMIPRSFSLNVPPPAQFYEHDEGRRQRRLLVWPGQQVDIGQMKNFGGIHDKITTIVVPPNTRATVHRDACIGYPPHVSGCLAKHTFGPGTYDARGERYETTNQKMNDTISEVIVNNIVPHREWLLQCCKGEVSPSSQCVNFQDPNGDGCKKVMEEYCTASKDNFFGPDCRRWMANLDDSLRNEVARVMCPLAETESEQEWCACYSANIPPEWETNTTKRALFRCLDPQCEGGNNPNALRPHGLVCPTSFVDCQQEDIKLQLLESGIDAATIQNACGNINVGGGTDGGRQSFLRQPTTLVLLLIAVAFVLGGVFLLGRK